MAVEFKSTPTAAVAVLPASLDDATGQELVTEVKARLSKGGKLVLDATGVADIDYQGLVHLISVRMYVSSPDQKNLLLAGMAPDAWRKIEDQGFADMFDSRPSLSEALAQMPDSGSGNTPPPPSPPQPDPPPPIGNIPRGPQSEPSDGNSWSKPGSSSSSAAKEAEEGVTSRGRQPRGQPSAKPNPLPVESAWSSYKPKTPAKSNRKALTKQHWIIGGSVLAALLIGLLWYFLASPGEPELTVSTNQCEVEVGDEPTPVRVSVKHGQLNRERAKDGLPEGLEFSLESEDPNGDQTYALSGQAAPNAKTGRASVILVAYRDSKKSVEKHLEITVNPKPLKLEWHVPPLPSLEVGQPMAAYAKIASGVETRPTAEGLPPGLVIEQSALEATTWELRGTPEEACNRNVTFKSGGDSIVAALNVRPKVEPQIAQTPAPTPTTPPTTEPPTIGPVHTPPAKDPPPPAIDNSMRDFLLERIDKLDSRYTRGERETLRQVVSLLQDASLIFRFRFGKDGQTEISDVEKDRFRHELKEVPGKAQMLTKDHLQIIVVGYASKKGKFKGNVRLSKQRAAAAKAFLEEETGKAADLCGDYGPTDIVDKNDQDGNRAVEIFAGVLNLDDDPIKRALADRFIKDFNERHGVHRED